MTVCSVLNQDANVTQHTLQDVYAANTPWWQLLFAIPIVILIIMYFDECIMRRKPWIGSALGGISVLGLTIVALCEPLKVKLKVQETMTTFIIIKAYLLTVPAFLLPTFRCIHGPEKQFNKFKKHICLNLKFIKHKMGNPGIVSFIMYAFLVTNMGEAVIFEFFLSLGKDWYDWRDDLELKHNLMNHLSFVGCLLNALCGLLVILMIPLPHNWLMFSDVDEEAVDVLYDITNGQRRNSKANANPVAVMPRVSRALNKKPSQVKGSSKYNDLFMVLQQDSNLCKVFAYLWIIAYTSWNWQFTTRFLGSGAFIHGPVHLIPPIIRSIVNGRTDLWVQSRLHVLWSTVIVWVPVSNLIGMSTKNHVLNNTGMFVWSLINILATFVCFILFIWLKMKKLKKVDLDQEIEIGNEPKQVSSSTDEEAESVVQCDL